MALSRVQGGEFSVKIRFIVNPISGGKEKVEAITDGVSRVFSNVEGIFEVRVTRFQGDAFHLSEEAVKKGYETVFACGGDGTVNEVASALVGSETVLGILPVGSGNALAGALGIPFGTLEAFGLPLKGRVKEIDAGQVCDRFFFSTAGMGLDASISKSYDERARKSFRRGILPYLPLAAMEYFRYDSGEVFIKHDEGHMKVSPLLLTVANTGEYGAKALISPGASPDDGYFDLCVVEDMGFFNALTFARRLFNGKVATMKNYRSIRTKNVEVVKKSPGVMQIDGEPLGCGEKGTFSMRPKALKVWVS